MTATTWLAKLPGRLTTIAVLLIAGVIGAAYMAGGVDGLAAMLLSKEVAHRTPGGATLRGLAVSILERRPVRRDTLMPLVRLVHTLDPDDPARDSVIRAASRLLSIGDVDGEARRDRGDRCGRGARPGTAARRSGVLAWRPLDPYFVIWLDEMASPDPSVAAHRFNTLIPPDGLLNAEWYLDELAVAFGDGRPIAFELVADSTGSNWRPMALAPDGVPAHARRIRVSTIGEALRVGLWGVERHRPDAPDEDVVAWWARIADAHGLPTYAAHADGR